MIKVNPRGSYYRAFEEKGKVRRELLSVSGCYRRQGER